MQQLVDQARRGSIRAASRLITLIEDDPSRIPELFAAAGDAPQARLVIGLTGPPGVGKSTLTDRLVSEWRRRWPDARIGVLAVDPSSPVSGGAVLGDRIRMMRHTTDPNVFIRSLANRLRLGGLSLGIHGSLRVMGLVGCDRVLIETVGVGQNEIDVCGIADLTCVVLAPGQGDAVQLLKAGLLEIADVFVVNKSDRDGADRLVRDLTGLLLMTRVRERRPDVVPVSARSGRGIVEWVDAMERCAAAAADRMAARRARALDEELEQAVMFAARRQLERAWRGNGIAREQLQNILAGRVTVDAAAKRLLQLSLTPAVSDESSADAAERNRSDAP